MIKKILFLFLICFLFSACGTDDFTHDTSLEEVPFVETPAAIVPEVPASVPVTSPESESDIEKVTAPEPEKADESEDNEIIAEQPAVQNYSEEYLRSIGNLSQNDAFIISPEVFEEDKNEIFKVINDLDQIMKKKDYNRWISYLTPESYEYWSNRHNLLELSRHLFSSDDFHFNNIREYFEMFFIPARKGRLVDEIRYVTPTYVKVVQYKNKTDIIYYFFEKHDDTWLLKLDTL